MIRVFGQTDTVFTSNGDIVLKPLKAKVHKKDNSDYYLELETDLSYIDYLVEGNIVVANTPTGDQAFRVTNISKTKNKLVSKCNHVFYDSKNYLIANAEITDKSCNDALTYLNALTEPESEFLCFSDIQTIKSYTCIRKSLFEALQDVVALYGGHLVRNNFYFAILNDIGTDNGIVVQYKKNLKDITVKENWSSVVTKLLPVGKDNIMLNAVNPSASIYVESDVQYDIPYCKTMTFQQDLVLDDYPSESAYMQALVDDLRAQAEDYLEKNSLPQISYTLKANLDRVTDIGDTIEVIDERLGINLMTHVIGFTYDCIFGQYTEIQFGNFAQTLEGLVGQVNKTSEKIAEQTVTNAMDSLGDVIKSRGVTNGWTWEKYQSGTVEAWKQVSIDSADVTWSAFLTNLFSGVAEVTYPFTINNAVVMASMNACTGEGWVSKAYRAGTSSVELSIIRASNTGTMTVNVYVRGNE